MNEIAPRRPLGDRPLFAVLTWFVALIGALVAAVAGATAFAVIAALRGETSKERLVEAAESTGAMWVTLLASQLITLVVALVACRIAGVRARERLGLVPTPLRGLDSALIVVATVVPFALGLLAATGVAQVFGAPDDPRMRMWSEGSRAASVAWVLCIAIVPGVVEETFYRGLLQRTLLLRWRPLYVIALSSAMFAIAHGTSTAAAFTFVLGAWLGVVAWRTGSVALTIVLHATLNGTWTAMQMLAARSSISDTTWSIVAGVVIVFGLVAFVPAVRILRRCAPSALDSTTTWPTSRVIGRAGVAALLTVGVLFAVIPPGATPPEPLPAPSFASLDERATRTASCPLEGEVELALLDDEPVRIELPAGASSVTEAIVAFDARRGVVWLAYAGDVSGKGKAGPPRGIVEQLVGGHPARLCIRFDDVSARPVVARVSLLADEQRIEAVLAQAATEGGWSTRGRFAPDTGVPSER